MTSKNLSANRGSMLVGASVLALGLAISSQAFAQAAPATDSTVVVTGSRVQRAGFSAPTPTVVQSVQTIEQQGFTDVTSFLQDVPSIRGNTNPSNPGIGTATTTNPGVSYINLRALGSGNVAGGGLPARTLVLVDGQRPVFQGTGGAIDLNMIPTIMLERTEVVTGGASAQYGSDAVAGVVNLIYKKNFNGLQAEVSYGQSTYGDDQTTHMAFVGGAPVLSGKGHVLLGVSYDKSEGVGPTPNNPRGWAAAQYGTLVGGGSVRYLVPNLQVSNITYGGLVVAANGVSVTPAASSSPLHGIAFTSAGTPFHYDYGNIYSSTDPTLQSGGKDNYGDNNGDTADMIAPLQRFTAVFKGEYNLTDHLNASVMLNYAYNDGRRDTASDRKSGPTAMVLNSNCTLGTANPFVVTAFGGCPGAPGSLLPAGTTTVSIARVNLDLGRGLHIWGGNQVYQFGGALGGDFDAFGSNWTWDGHANYGSNFFFTQVSNNQIKTRFADAINVVSVGGIAQCASATARAAGCLPYNPFVNNSAASAAYFIQTSHGWNTTTRTDFNANLRGAPFSTWAGKVSVAAGVEYRSDTINQKADPDGALANYAYANVAVLAGRVNVGEAYAEAVVPLLSGLPFAKELDFDGAVREANYSYSGNNTSWKLGLTYDVTDEVRFRGSYSQDARAPNVSELFTANAINQTQITYYNANLTQLINQVLTPTTTSGNTSLIPETSHTTSFGVVLSPKFIPGLRLSADYWGIDIQNAIFTPSQAQLSILIQNCQQGQTQYCTAADFDPVTKLPTHAYIRPVNAAGLKTSGVDISADYTTRLDRFWRDAPGRLTANWNATYTAHYIAVAPGNPTFDTAGQVGNGVVAASTAAVPHWAWDANFNYAVGPVALNFNVRYIGQGVLDVSAVPGGVNNALLKDASGNYFNSVAAKTYFNVGAQYNIPSTYTWGKNLQLFGNINNLTNLAPNAFGRDPTTDVIGRFYSVGLRMKM